MATHFRKGLDGRMRDEDGEIHRNIEREYDKDFGVRSDMRLDTFGHFRPATRV